MRFDAEEIAAVTEVVRSGQLSSFYRNYLGGGKVQEFEQHFAQMHGAKHPAVSVSNGTAALFVALKAVGVGTGDEVITTPYTFGASASVITMCGATPVFADIDPDTYNLTAETIEERITHNTKAILPVHLLGCPCDMTAITELAERKQLFVIEDCAQALGAARDGKLVGTWAHLGCFSFQESKSMTTAGEGGMIISDHPVGSELIRRCQGLRNHGEYYHDENSLGYNLRMTEIAAAFGTVQLKKLPEMLLNQVRNAFHVIMHIGLASRGEIKPPYLPDMGSPKGSVGEWGARHTFYIIGCQMQDLQKRSQFLRKLQHWNKGRPGDTIGTGYKRLIYEIPYFARFARNCPNAEKVRDHALWLDIHRFGKSIADMQRFILDVKKAFM